jgi:5,10-methylene-tetrahydrofolate dehydrogenase/methenyl tetrahydrofolate cyclohydrolase
MDMEWRKPFGLVMNKNQIPEHQHYQLRYTIGESVLTPPISVSDYTFKRIDSDLLIAIDNDNVSSVKKALEKDKIDVNNLYVIPVWEVPEAGKPVFQTFLHRALWERSENVFKFLLDKGANPRIKGHCHDTVISNVFDDQYKKEDFLKFGKMLVDAGMTIKEIQQEAKYKDDKSAVSKLMKYATTKRESKLIQKKKAVVRSTRNERIKD